MIAGTLNKSGLKIIVWPELTTYLRSDQMLIARPCEFCPDVMTDVAVWILDQRLLKRHSVKRNPCGYGFDSACSYKHD